MRASSWIRGVAVTILAGWTTATVVAQGGIEIAGAGAAPFPTGTTFNLIAVEGLQVGVGATASSLGTVTGDLHVTLLGVSAAGLRQEISYDAHVNQVSVSDGTVTLVGMGTLNMGDGSVPLLSVPLTMTATAGTVDLLLGTTQLPQATLNKGAITIK